LAEDKMRGKCAAARGPSTKTRSAAPWEANADGAKLHGAKASNRPARIAESEGRKSDATGTQPIMSTTEGGTRSAQSGKGEKLKGENILRSFQDVDVHGGEEKLHGIEEQAKSGRMDLWAGTANTEKNQKREKKIRKKR